MEKIYKNKTAYRLVCMIMLLIVMISGMCAVSYRADSFLEYIKTEQLNSNDSTSIESEISTYIQKTNRENAEIVNSQEQYKVSADNRQISENKSARMTLIQSVLNWQIKITLLIIVTILLKMKGIRRSSDVIIRYIHQQDGGKA